MDYLDNSTTLLREDSHFVRKMLIGGGVLMMSILVIPYFFYQGYMMKILRETEGGVLEELPTWDNWGDLFMDGVIAFFFSFLIGLPLYVLLYLGIFAAGPESLAGSLLQFGGNILSLLLGYVTIVLLAILMRDGYEELTDFDRIKQILLSREYIITYLIITAIGVGLMFFIMFFVIFTLGLGLIALPFILFIVQAVIIYMLGRAITAADPTVGRYRTDVDEVLEEYEDEYQEVTDESASSELDEE